MSFDPRNRHDFGADLHGADDSHDSDFFAAGNCLGQDPDMFFPGPGGDARAAKALCATCPVRTQCLDYALVHGYKHGVWGGMTEGQRRRLNRPRPQVVSVRHLRLVPN